MKNTREIKAKAQFPKKNFYSKIEIDDKDRKIF